jgi:hypothetical protein
MEPGVVGLVEVSLRASSGAGPPVRLVLGDMFWLELRELPPVAYLVGLVDALAHDKW